MIRRVLDASPSGAGHPGAEAAGDVVRARPRALVEACERAGVVLQVNQNMRYDQSVRALKTLLDDGRLGEPVLATIEMRAIPHWMPWARDGRSLSTFIMSIHHLDTFRYWLGDPARVLASTRPDPRTTFPHDDGINLYILEYENGARASRLGRRLGGARARRRGRRASTVRWRFEGTEGLALGEIGWPGWPARVPSTIDYSTIRDDGAWHRPRWPEAWFPDAFAGTMGGLLRALETGEEPDISGRDNLKTIALCEAVLAAGRRASRRAAGANSSRIRAALDPLHVSSLTGDREPCRRGPVSRRLGRSCVGRRCGPRGPGPRPGTAGVAVARTANPPAGAARGAGGRAPPGRARPPPDRGLLPLAGRDHPPDDPLQGPRGPVHLRQQRFCAELATTLEAIKGKTDYDFFPRELAEKYRADDQQGPRERPGPRRRRAARHAQGGEALRPDDEDAALRPRWRADRNPGRSSGT